MQPPDASINATHTDIRHAPEDESEEGVEKRRHQGQQVREERDDLRDDESPQPRQGEDTSPSRPSDDGMRGLVNRALEDAEKDETGGDGGVEDAEEDESGDHEGEGHLLVDLVSEGAEGGGGHVLVPGVDVDDRADDGEDDDLGDSDGPEGFGEVLGLAHFGDEAGEGDLSDEGVGDVEEGGHGGYEGRAGEGEGGVDWCAEFLGEAEGFVFEAGEDGGQEDGDEGEEGGGAGDFGERVEGAGERTEPADDGGDHREDDGALAVVRHGVEVLGGHQDVEALNEGVVQNEHDGRGIPDPGFTPEQHLPDVTYVPDLGVTETELPEHEGRVEHDGCHDDGQDQSGDQSEDGVGPGK
ncbi:hypothetical protein V499_06278 [Pseudogymnoascus sp. VKM F-103]|nr:hypothetical protein V499_06278 [Pseudogymnoascus sp. VKM F-103]